MAKKKSKPKFVWNGYVNVSIPENQTEKLKKYITDSKQVHMDANQAQIDLYTFKIYFDEDNKNYRASLTCYDPDSDNWGKMIGAFAGDWYTALAVVLYKHFHISGEEWGDVQSFSDAAFG